MHAHLLIPFVLLWCAAIAWSDWQLRRIPNSLVAAGFTVALLGLVFQGQTLFGIGPSQSLFGAAIGLLVFLPLYMLKIMGAGDVKLFAAIGALCGPWGLLPVWLIASLLAGRMPSPGFQPNASFRICRLFPSLGPLVGCPTAHTWQLAWPVSRCNPS